jgi:fatty acid desaturase
VGIGARLANLDDRVIGRREQRSAKDYRNTFAMGLVGTLTILFVLTVTGRWAYVGTVGGFVGVTLASGIRWHRSKGRSEP